MSPEVSAQTSSSQPSLPSLVALHLAKTFAVALGYAKIEFFHVLVLAQALRRAVHDDAAGFQDIAVGGVFQRHVGVLLGKQEGDALRSVQLADDLEDLLHDLRREAHGGLVEEDHLGAAHHGAADGAHLLLAAGGVARHGVLPLPQARKRRIDHGEVAPDGGVAVPTGESAGQQVLLNGEMAEAVPALQNLDAAAPD